MISMYTLVHNEFLSKVHKSGLNSPTCLKLFTTCVVSSNVNVEIKRSILKADKMSFNLCNNVDEVIKREARFKRIFDHNHTLKL